MEKLNLQQRILNAPEWVHTIHSSSEIPSDFRPWLCNLSPSSLYVCSLKCRKLLGIKTYETKWISIKRWSSQSSGINLPDGAFVSVKRKEEFISCDNPKFEKTEYVMVLLPHGNMWFVTPSGNPITEEWLWEENDGISNFELLLKADSDKPLKGYVESVYNYLNNNPDMIGIHLKRKR